jgi:2-polyprenyl-3-methyl-5-hydroxy-6-metoxy-1,4-benzoquinol methylase
LFSLAISTFIQNVPAMPSSVKKGKILDIGCGAGDTLVLLKKVGWDTYGLDMDKFAIENAKKRGLHHIMLGTYKSLSKYPDNYFDAIRLYHVIEHIDNPGLCLELMRRKLKKNGELVIGTPNVDSVITSVFKSYWYNLDSPRHLFLFSPKTLGRLAKQKKFTVQKIEYCAAGGIVGSIQYILDKAFHTKTNLIHKLYIVLLFYPFDWILNKMKSGDVFVLRAKIQN